MVIDNLEPHLLPLLKSNFQPRNPTSLLVLKTYQNVSPIILLTYCFIFEMKIMPTTKLIVHIKITQNFMMTFKER